MEKLLISAITVLILLAFTTIGSATFTVANSTSVPAAISNDAEEPKTLFIQVLEFNESNNLVLNQVDDLVNTVEVKDIKQDTSDSDRVVFVTIGSLVLIGILLLHQF
jgi:hypothetical protein